MEHITQHTQHVLCKEHAEAEGMVKYRDCNTA